MMTSGIGQSAGSTTHQRTSVGNDIEPSNGAAVERKNAEIEDNVKTRGEARQYRLQDEAVDPPSLLSQGWRLYHNLSLLGHAGIAAKRLDARGAAMNKNEWESFLGRLQSTKQNWDPASRRTFLGFYNEAIATKLEGAARGRQ
jgi:hypothetical protein